MLGGLEKARGDIIKFLDDYIYRENCFDKAYSAFISMSNLVYFHNNFQVIDAKDNAIYRGHALIESPNIALNLRISDLWKVHKPSGLCY